MYDDLLKAWIGELKFSNMQNEFLLNVLDEINAMTDDKLAKWVIKNAKERYNLDKLIHARQLFPNPKWFWKER